MNSLDWIGQHWVGVIVIAAFAAACGWASTRLHDGEIAEVETRASANHDCSVSPARVAASSPGNYGDESVQTHLEYDEPAQPPRQGTSPLSEDDLAIAIADGTESERLAALTKALQHDIELRADVLIQAYTNDVSDDVRLLAFTTYIDSVSDDVEVVRAALQAATNNTSSIIQAEAYRRLDDLARYEAGMAAAAAQGLP
jgi:hypothetical protein